MPSSLKHFSRFIAEFVGFSRCIAISNMSNKSNMKHEKWFSARNSTRNGNETKRINRYICYAKKNYNFTSEIQTTDGGVKLMGKNTKIKIVSYIFCIFSASI